VKDGGRACDWPQPLWRGLGRRGSKTPSKIIAINKDMTQVRNFVGQDLPAILIKYTLLQSGRNQKEE
jgi:hypothetical protein